MDRKTVRRLLSLLVIIVLAIPAFFVWAFVLVDVSTDFDLNPIVKALWLAVMVLPLVGVLYYLAVRTRCAMTSHTAQRPALQPWLGWAIIGALSLAALPVLAVVAFTVFIDVNQPGAPGAFYDAPSPLPPEPLGTVIRSEPLDGAPAGWKAWKILYLSTSYDGQRTAVSGILVVPEAPAPADGRLVVAWNHGALGGGANCAPSLKSDWATHLREVGLDTFLAAGYAVVATDYQGLGTRGPHPFLVGESAAMNVLDGVRAAYNFPEAETGTAFAVWGESQGGHASLFAGELASSYAPELKLVGVAAAVPPTDLAELFRRNLGTTFGNVLGANAFTTWPGVYDEAKLSQIVKSIARPVVKLTARYCFSREEEVLAVLPTSLFLKVIFISHQPPDIEPWKSLLAENTPGHAKTQAPIFIVQGADDPLVRPDITEAFAKSLCAKGDTVEYRSYPGVGHVDAYKTTPDVTAWIADRFAGKPAPSTCS